MLRRKQPALGEVPPQLPYQRFDYFLADFSVQARGLFWAVFGLLIAGLIWAVVGAHHPEWFSLTLTRVAEDLSQPLTLERGWAHYREYELLAKGYLSFVGYAAGYIQVTPWMILGFALFQVVGWSLLLAASSKVNSWHAYLLYGLFAAHLLLPGPAEILFAADPFRLVSVAILSVFLGLAFAFRSEQIQRSPVFQLGVYLGLLAGLHMAAGLAGGWAGLHRMLTYDVPVVVFMLLVGLFFVAKDLVNLVVYALTNRKMVGNRLNHKGVYGAFALVLLLLLFLMLAVQQTQLPAYVGVIRPLYVLLLAAGITVFTSQNVYFQLKPYIRTQEGFVWLVLGFALVCVGFLAYQFSAYEQIWLSEIEWLTAHVFFIISLMYALYIWANHHELLTRKTNLYFGLLIAPRVRFISIWFLAAGVLILLEGSQNWRTYTRGVTLYNTQVGDNFLLSDSTQAAEGAYRTAYEIYSWHPKAIHNLSLLRTQRNFTLADIEQFAEESRQVYPFTYTTLNYCNLLRAARQYDRARIELAGLLRERPDPILHIAQAQVFKALNQPDSVIDHLRKALLLRPDMAEQYSNLGIIYLQNNRRQDAERFFAAGLATRSNDPFVRMNAAFYSLLADTALYEPRAKADTTQPVATYMEALLAFRKRNYAQADTLISYLARNQQPDGLLLRMLTAPRLRTQPIDSSIVQFIAGYHSAWAPLAWHNVAAFYQTQQVPEMAAYYYRLAGNSGIAADRLQAILLTADAGAHDSAYAQLMRFRVDYPEYRQRAEQEMNLLARGYGDEFILLNWPLTREQKLRLGIYAGAAGQPGYSSTVYNSLVEQDSQWVAPYLQLGRIFSTHYGDTLALMQYEAGLKVAKNDPELNAERARCLIRLGRLAEADKLIQTFTEKHGQEPLWQLAHAERALKAGQPGKARTLLEAGHKLHPFRTDITLSLARLYADTNENQAGLTLMTEAVRINHQNPLLWARYAYFAARTAFTADALPAMERGIALARNKAEKTKLQVELNELRNYLLNN